MVYGNYSYVIMGEEIMAKSFDKMTKGEQFLKLLRVEHEEQLKYARYFSSILRYGLNTYLYSPEERAAKEKELSFLEMDIKYAQDALNMLGAENDEPVTESKDSETPNSDKFTEITCTTV